MNVARKFVTSFLLLALLFTEACTKKKPPLPPQAPAPTLGELLPEEIPEVKEKPLPPSPPKPSDAEQANNKKPSKKSPKVAAKKTTPPANTTAAVTPPPAPAPAPAQTAPQNANPVVASSHEAPAPEMTVAAAISSKDANKQKEDTAHMIDSTESVLKGLTRQLNDEEKGMRTQIETYVQQSRKATADGDFERAYKLAEKAQTLATALTKQ
jgi:hypothetical protein